MARERPASDPANRDITLHMLARTGFTSIAEMSANMMFATKKSMLNRHPFRPGVPARLKRFDTTTIDGKEHACMILEYVDGIDGQTVEYAQPVDTMFTSLRFIPREKVGMTLIEKDRLEKGF